VADDAEEREEFERLLERSGAPCEPVAFILISYTMPYYTTSGLANTPEQKVEKVEREKGGTRRSLSSIFRSRSIAN